MEKPLIEFCRYCISKYGDPNKIDEEMLAREFVSFYGISSLPKLKEIRGLIDNNIGILKASVLPKSLAGFHSYAEGSTPVIQYDLNSWQGRAEHSIFHEIFEIIIECFGEMHIGFNKPEKICQKADRFAGAILMQEEVFKPILLSTGFDMIFVREWFGRAYSAIPIRAKQLFPNGPDFLVAIYNLLGKRTKHPGEFRAVVSIRSDHLILGYRTFRYKLPRSPHHLLPTRGDRPSFGSLVEKTISQRRPYYLEKVTGLDFWHYNDLSVLMRPVKGKTENQGVNKVILVGMRHSHRSFLQPQLNLVKPVTINETYQLI